MEDKKVKVYECVDHTPHRDFYIPLFIELSLEKAIAKVMDGFGDPNWKPPSDDDWDVEVYCTIEIRERVIGELNSIKVVWTKTFEMDWNEIDEVDDWIEVYKKEQSL